MLVQHDLEFVENINVDDIIIDMEKDEELKLVSFNKDPNSVMLRDPTKTGVLQICHNIEAAPKDQGFGETKKTQTVAFQNIHNIFFTLDTSQLLSGWLKELALLNIPHIFFTLDTFQLLSGWLKELAPANILYIRVTLDTSQLLSGWLKELAY